MMNRGLIYQGYIPKDFQYILFVQPIEVLPFKAYTESEKIFFVNMLIT